MSNITTADPSADAPADSRLDKLKDRSLSLSAMMYLVGDAGLYASGKLSKRTDESGAGLWWLAGGLACARYGSPKAEKQIELVSTRLGNYLHKQGVEIPNDPNTASLRKKGGIVDHLESFMYTYPSQILNTAYTVGGLQLVRSGLMPNAGKQKDLALAAAGALVIGGALGGLLIKEQQPDPDNKPKTMGGKAKSWLQEKPLRWPAIAYGINDVMLAKSALTDMRDPTNHGGYRYKFLTVATYALGNILFSMSSKGHGGNDAHTQKVMQKLAETSASVIAAQPPQLQEALVQQISGFLAAQPEVKMKADEISALLHAKLAETAKTYSITPNWQLRSDHGNGYSPFL